jgi:ribonuclease HI
VKGHADDALNNRVDGMARAAIEAMRAARRAQAS